MGISREGILAATKVESIPTNKDRILTKIKDLHQTLIGRRLEKVITIKQTTKVNLQKGPANIGVIKKIERSIIFNRLSITLSQLLSP